MILITCIGGILRFTNLDKHPNSLNVDEVSIGYNAYSILKTGKDEYGNLMPLSFKSLGDYKPPIYIYLTALPIAIFGLNEFSVRFVSALLGTLTIPLIFFFLRFITEKISYALLATILLAISPWHIYFSRMGSESLTALFFTIAGMFCFLQVLNSKKVWFIPSIVLLITAMYTYHAQRVFLPLMIAATLLLAWKRSKLSRKESVLPVIVLVSLTSAFLISIIVGSGANRAQMTVITNDVEFIRYVLVDPINNTSGFISEVGTLFNNEYLLLASYWIRKYLAYFQPSFLFYNSLGMTQGSSYGMGILYLFEVPLLLMGIYILVRSALTYKYFIILWILMGIFPASLTLNEQHPIRTLVIMPMVLLISAIGAMSLWQWTCQHMTKIQRGIVVGIFGVFITWNLGWFFLMYTVHFPSQKGEGIMEGTRESVLVALEHSNEYDQIIYDPVRGVDGPYIMNAPHAYILFYSQYDPNQYHQLPKNADEESFSFDKFSIRKINWVEDQNKTKTLFIGSPWSIPLDTLQDNEILKKIYLTNGKLALIVVGKK